MGLFSNDAPTITYPDIEKLIFQSAKYLDNCEKAIGDINLISDQKLFEYFYNETIEVREKSIKLGWINPDEDTDAVWKQLAHDQGLFYARWAKLGFPRIILNEKQINQFIVSSIHGDALAEINPPWPQFIIQFPKNILKIVNNGKEDTVERIMVSIPDLESQKHAFLKRLIFKLPNKIPSLNRYWRITWDTFGDRQGFVQDTVSDLLKYSLTNTPNEFSHLPTEEKKTGAFITHACIRIVFCTVIEMMMHRDLFEHKTQEHKVPLHKKEMRKNFPYVPISNKYIFTKPITINYRESVNNYLRGNVNSPSVRFLVRGHYRNQPYGPNSSLRKWKYIPPFWKGNGDTAIRPHIIK